MQDNAPLWQPDADRVRDSLLARFITTAQQSTGRTFDSYEQLWQWSVDESAQFWHYR